jgi:hypothetical protein
MLNAYQLMISLQVASSLKDKALARLSSQPSISTCVTQFRTKFPTWNHVVPQLLLKLGDKKAKKRKNAKSKTHEKEQIDVTKSSKEDQAKLIRSCTNDNVSGKDQTVSFLNSDGSIAIHNQDGQQKSSVIAEETPKSISAKISAESVSKETDKDAGTTSEMKIAEKSLAEVKRFSEHLKVEKYIENNNLVLESSPPVSPDATTVDPFFVCEDGKTEYLTSVNINTGLSKGTDTHQKEKLSKQPPWTKNDERKFFQAERRKNMQAQKPTISNFRTFQQRPPMHNSGNRSKQSPYLKQKINVVHHEKKQTSATGMFDQKYK